jgi:hypothetical protein
LSFIGREGSSPSSPTKKGFGTDFKKVMIKKITSNYIYLLIFGIFLFTGIGVYSNVQEQKSIDRSKIPEKVEDSNGFQRWITNIKNKEIDISADGFGLLEENEIYNTKWMKVYSIDEKDRKDEYDKNIEAHRDIQKVIYSPSDRIFIDYRNEPREGYNTNEVHFYGLLDDKIIDARIVDCSIRANCYFDRAYFLENDIFVISEISRTIDKKDKETPLCSTDELCDYSFKLHLIDLKNNSRLVYESESFDAVLSELIPEL